MPVGLFRQIRRKRVIRLDEDLAFGVKKVMHERWDFLTLIEFHQNLEELEHLLVQSALLRHRERDLARRLDAARARRRRLQWSMPAVPATAAGSWCRRSLGAPCLLLALRGRRCSRRRGLGLHRRL